MLHGLQGGGGRAKHWVRLEITFKFTEFPFGFLYFTERQGAAWSSGDECVMSRHSWLSLYYTSGQHSVCPFLRTCRHVLQSCKPIACCNSSLSYRNENGIWQGKTGIRIVGNNHFRSKTSRLPPLPKLLIFLIFYLKTNPDDKSTCQ